jgi:opacity protein-like surface antigen
MMKKCLIIAGCVLVLSPAAARADWLLTPILGTTFGGTGESNGNFTYGASIGWMGAGIVGFEAELASTPNVFDIEDELDIEDADPVNDRGMSMMFNAIVGVPMGGSSGGGIRPFFTGGLGWVRSTVEFDEELFEETSSRFGVNLGAGAVGFINEHLGLRGDIRWFKTIDDPDFVAPVQLDSDDISFWRGTAGLTFRW